MMNKIKNSKNNIILWGFFGILLCAYLFLSIKEIRTSRVNVNLNSDNIAFDENENKFTTNGLGYIPKGIYEITVSYEASEDITTDVSCYTKGHKSLYTDNPKLSQYENEQSFNIWLNDECEQLKISLKGGDEKFSVYGVNISTARNSRLYEICLLTIYFAFICGAAYIIHIRERLSKYSTEIIGLSVIVIFASLGLFTRYLTLGHDLEYHLTRIEGVKESLLLGDIPSKVQSNWAYGWGYASSAMYGEILLVLPALMRICGFTVMTSYKTFVFVVNLCTALSSFFCFKKMCKNNKYTALIVSFLYTCAPYRICCVYLRSAVGEYTAPIFLPMIALGFYYAYAESTESDSYGKKLLVPVLGFTGLIQTHMLSCFMSAMFIFILCLVEWKKTFTKKTFIYLLKIVCWTVVLNLWFLVPFMRFMGEPINIARNEDMPRDFQWYGLSITEIFAQRISGANYYNFAFLTNLSSRMSLPFGNGFVVAFITYLYLQWNKRLGKKTRGTSIMLVISCIAVFLASNLFPYSRIDLISKTLSGYLTKVQFPYRYLTMAIIFASVFLAMFFPKLIKKCGKQFAIIFSIIIIAINSDQSLSYIYSLVYNGSCMVYYDSANVNSYDFMGAQYSYEGTDVEFPKQERYTIRANDADFELLSRRANRFSLSTSVNGENAYIELPIYYYPGYDARDNNNKKLSIERGGNNRVKVLLPKGYSGEISVRYREPALWRICEIISLAAFICFLYINSSKYRSNVKSERMSQGNKLWKKHADSL